MVLEHHPAHVMWAIMASGPHFGLYYSWRQESTQKMCGSNMMEQPHIFPLLWMTLWVTVLAMVHRCVYLSMPLHSHWTNDCALLSQL